MHSPPPPEERRGGALYAEDAETHIGNICKANVIYIYIGENFRRAAPKKQNKRL